MTTRWIVVGAGSGGCVAAARLSEDPENHVTLLEQGPDLRAHDVPAHVSSSDFTKAFEDESRTYGGLLAARAGGKPFPYPTGRGVGGSSLVNAMIGLRGSTAQYRSWGWYDTDAAWSKMLLPEELPAADELGAVDRALLSAADGAERTPLTRRDGCRVTTAEAYLWPAAERSNLDIRAGLAVDRVLLDGRRAVGVRSSDGEDLPADRVVVSAGAIHSPALLLRSGVTVDGIGEHLQDHPAATFTLQLREPAAESGALAAAAFLADGDLQFLSMNHTGFQGAGRGYGALLLALMRPRGRSGTVRAASPGSGRHPEVTLDPLDDRADIAALRSGVGTARELLGKASFRKVVSEVYVDAHGTRLEDLVTGAEIDSWLRSSATTYLHASSSCAMGTVVGQDGAVRDHDGLYVCDASVFPSVPEVNPHLPTVMLAERLAARWLRGLNSGPATDAVR